MTPLEFFVALATAALAPGRNHATASHAIVTAVSEERPLFHGDAARLRTAAIVVSIAYRESSLRNDAVSATNDFCLLGIHGRPDLARDPVACVRTGLAMLRQSMQACPEYPLAVYASGPAGCTNARARRISNDRIRLAHRLLGDTHP